MQPITVMSNAAGSWAVLGRFIDSPQMRIDLDATCGSLHYLTGGRTHFKMVDEKGATIATLRNGARRFEPIQAGDR